MSFCKQCGNKLEENTKFCSGCGSLSEDSTPAEQINSQQPGEAQYEDLMNSYQEPVVAPVQDPLFTAMDQPYVPSFGPVGQPPKKKIPKVLIGVLAAIVVVFAMYGVVMHTSLALGLKNKINSAVQSPVKYYKSVEKQNKEVTIKQLTNAYDKYLEADLDKVTAVEVDIKINANSKFLESNFFPTSLTSVELKSYSAFSSKDGFMGEYGFLVNDKKLVDITTYFDVANKTLIASIPQLTDKYFYGDFTDLFDDMMSEVDFSSYDKMKELNLSSEEIEELLTKYTDLLVDAASDVKREKNAKLTVGDTTGKFTKITSTITEKDAKLLLSKVLKTAKKDKTLLKIVEAYGLSKIEYMEFIDSALEEVQLMNEEESNSDQALIVVLYIDSKGTIVGRNISIEDEYSEFEMGYYVIKNDDKLEARIFANANGNGIEITTSPTISDGKYTGELKFDISSQYGFNEELTIDYKDFQITEKNGVNFVNGIFEIDLSDIIDATDTSVKLECSETNQKQKAKFSAIYLGDEVGYVEVTFGIVEGKEINIPEFDENDGYNLLDDDAMEDFVASIDWDKVLEPIEDVVADFEELFGVSMDYEDEELWIDEEDDALYQYTSADLIGEWVVPETGLYYVFNEDGTFYLYENKLMDPLTSVVGGYSAFAPAMDEQYNSIPGLGIYMESSPIGMEEEVAEYEYISMQFYPTESGFEIKLDNEKVAFEFVKVK